MVERDARPVLGLFAKVPRAGLVKTRLVPPLTPPEAADLARATLVDVWRTMGRVDGARRVLVHAPDDEAEAMGALVGPGADLRPQGGGSLGDRLERFLGEALASGAAAAIAVGSDHPGLPADHLRGALDALREADVVLGPTPDGGYHLLGLRGSPPPGLLDGIPWSTGEVLEATCRAAEGAGLRVVLGPPWIDVDVEDDLEACRLRLEEQDRRSDPDTGRETLRWLRDRRSSGSASEKPGLPGGSAC